MAVRRSFAAWARSVIVRGCVAVALVCGVGTSINWWQHRSDVPMSALTASARVTVLPGSSPGDDRPIRLNADLGFPGPAAAKGHFVIVLADRRSGQLAEISSSNLGVLCSVGLIPAPARWLRGLENPDSMANDAVRVDAASSSIMLTAMFHGDADLRPTDIGIAVLYSDPDERYQWTKEISPATG